MNPTTPLRAVVANARGEIFDLEGYAAVGMAGADRTVLSTNETTPMPHGGELMFLPDRIPVLYDLATETPAVLKRNPYSPEEPIFPVAVFNSPGYVNTYTCAYTESEGAASLPLFSYGAVGWHRDKFYSAVIRVDREKRQDLRLMPRAGVVAGVRKMRKRLPGNRLREHLENCALVYGCPAGKNFFLGRYEAPLPTSKQCNARCLGCLSLQEKSGIPHSQERITFTPTPDEIAQVALAHIGRVDRPVVSFGQGCEGDPLLAAEVIAPAIRLIRSKTRKGTINMNTNASLPHVLGGLFDAGLDSMRVSLNSMRADCYHAYFKPRGYEFSAVEESIRTALEKGRYVSINYLNCPGFTDTPEEVKALTGFLGRYPIHMIQWRNLNFDPLRYIQTMKKTAEQGPPMGMKKVLTRIKSRFPQLKHGYFNPPKEKFLP